MENVAQIEKPIKDTKKGLFSLPLLKQSLKANLAFWIILTAAAALIFVIVNLVVGTKKLFTNIDMGLVSQYVRDEGLSWFQILGLLERMGFSLSRIQIMSQIDLNSILNDLIYRIAGIFLPMIYVIITANRLVAAQVSDGSMAYILSTPTNRKKVVRTQFLFLSLSILAMYIVVFLFAYSTDFIANQILNYQAASLEQPQTIWVPLRVPLYMLGSFFSIFCLGGICFGASCFFNKSNNSIAAGGGICVLSFLGCVLGLFGNKIFVAVGVGVPAMNIFNYLSVFTLIDTESMGNLAKACAGLEGSFDFTWLWKIAILFGIGCSFAFAGGLKFLKKDLPL